MKTRVSIIVAIDEKRGIGKGGDLLFKIPEDGKRLRVITKGHPLVMGRKTFASLGRLLPERAHIVVTRDPDSIADLSYQPNEIVSSVEEGLAAAQYFPGADEVFIFGGGQIYAEVIDQELVDRLYLTIVKGDYGADTFFPEYKDLGFHEVKREEREADGFKYAFLILDKKE